MAGDVDLRKGRTGKMKDRVGNHLGRKQKELLIAEVELLLAEKQTFEATMRTGILVMPIPLSVFMVLITTSSYYEADNLYLALVGMSMFCLALLGIGVYLIQSSLRHIHRLNRKIRTLRKRDEEVGGLIEETK
jgi:uncharacterized membrane protein YkgB